MDRLISFISWVSAKTFHISACTLSILLARLFSREEEVLERHTQLYRQHLISAFEADLESPLFQKDEDFMRSLVELNALGYFFFPSLREDMNERWMALTLRRWKWERAIQGYPAEEDEAVPAIVQDEPEIEIE